MRSSTDRTEESLRAEITDLKRQLEEQKRMGRELSRLDAVPPSRGKLWTIMLLAALAIAVAFVAGYLPRYRRESLLVAEANVESHTDPVVNVVTIVQSSGKSELTLPANIQAVTE